MYRRKKRLHMSTFCWSKVEIIRRFKIHYNTEIKNIVFFTSYFLSFGNKFYPTFVFEATIFIFCLIIRTNLILLNWIKQVIKSVTIDIFSYPMTYWKLKMNLSIRFAISVKHIFTWKSNGIINYNKEILKIQNVAAMPIAICNHSIYNV